MNNIINRINLAQSLVCHESLDTPEGTPKGTPVGSPYGSPRKESPVKKLNNVENVRESLFCHESLDTPKGTPVVSPYGSPRKESPTKKQVSLSPRRSVGWEVAPENNRGAKRKLFGGNVEEEPKAKRPRLEVKAAEVEVVERVQERVIECSVDYWLPEEVWLSMIGLMKAKDWIAFALSCKFFSHMHQTVIVPHLSWLRKLGAEYRHCVLSGEVGESEYVFRVLERSGCKAKVIDIIHRDTWIIARDIFKSYDSRPRVKQFLFDIVSAKDVSKYSFDCRSYGLDGVRAICKGTVDYTDNAYALLHARKILKAYFEYEKTMTLQGKMIAIFFEAIYYVMHHTDKDNFECWLDLLNDVFDNKELFIEDNGSSLFKRGLELLKIQVVKEKDLKDAEKDCLNVLRKKILGVLEDKLPKYLEVGKTAVLSMLIKCLLTETMQRRISDLLKDEILGVFERIICRQEWTQAETKRLIGIISEERERRLNPEQEEMLDQVIGYLKNA